MQNDYYCTEKTFSVSCNESTLLVCHVLFSALIFDLFNVSNKDSGKLLFSRELES